MRTLTEREALAALRRGAGVEQLLPAACSAESVTWLAAARVGQGYVLRRHHVRDEGDGDLTEFASVDPGEGHGEGVILGVFDAEDALLRTAGGAGAFPDQWVGAGTVQSVHEERHRLVALVQRVERGDYEGEAGLDLLLDDFQSSVPCPDASALIFWPDEDLGPDPSATAIVDRALAYRPIAL